MCADTFNHLQDLLESPINEKTPQPQFHIISPLLYTCTMVLKFCLDFLLYLSTLLELPDGGCKRRLLSELSGCSSVEWTKSDEFRQLDLLHIWGEPPSETSTGAWLECISDEILNKAKRKKHQCFLSLRAIWCRWIVWPLTCLLPQMPWWRVQMRKLFKMGFNKKQTRELRLLLLVQEGPGAWWSEDAD